MRTWRAMLVPLLLAGIVLGVSFTFVGLKGKAQVRKTVEYKVVFLPVGQTVENIVQDDNTLKPVVVGPENPAKEMATVLNRLAKQGWRYRATLGSKKSRVDADGIPGVFVLLSKE